MRSTDVNETSSRSHLIFFIYIKRKDKRSGRCTVGKIIFIDLAGSESLSEIGVDLQRYKEGMQINDSLICLDRLIRQISLKVPNPAYDLHPLTELMQDSLGGNSKTLMIACISPSEYDIAQTRKTLDYALTTGTITNKATTSGFDQSFISKEEKNRLFEESEKQQIIQSIVRSKRIIGGNVVEHVTKSVKFPEMIKLTNKSSQELRNLTITKLEWFATFSIGFILNDGSSCKVGTDNLN